MGEQPKRTQETVAAHYEHMYKTDAEDSPERSRLELARFIRERLRAIAPTPEHRANIANIGSGPQLLEKVMFSSLGKNGPAGKDRDMLANAVNYITLDVAPINPDKLRMSRPNFMHVRAQAEMLPLKDDSFDIIVSNLAIDFAPRKALGHVAQALRRKSSEHPNGGTFYINLHHPEMMRIIVAEASDTFVATFIRDGLAATNNPETVKFYESTEEIRTVFASYGLKVESVEEIHDEGTHDAWWRVIGTRAEA
jgi:hypothetical protein